VTDPVLRASDLDRERVVGALQRHTAAGRLSLDEFAERAGWAYAAATLADLAAVTRDLPAEVTPAPGTAPQHRQLLVAFLLAAAALMVLGVLLAVAR
jgi:DUF1707 SHOCT-like domain